LFTACVVQSCSFSVGKRKALPIAREEQSRAFALHHMPVVKVRLYDWGSFDL